MTERAPQAIAQGVLILDAEQNIVSANSEQNLSMTLHCMGDGVIATDASGWMMLRTSSSK